MEGLRSIARIAVCTTPAPVTATIAGSARYRPRERPDRDGSGSLSRAHDSAILRGGAEARLRNGLIADNLYPQDPAARQRSSRAICRARASKRDLFLLLPWCVSGGCGDLQHVGLADDHTGPDLGAGGERTRQPFGLIASLQYHDSD